MRCAIYTRKSVEAGLEQDFNSLDAQREACEAYITSQKSEGWVCLPQHYDDGGFSGGNTDRPALNMLMEDIRKGNVDCVVVYKVDRLSRSLLDFSRLMDLFEQRNITFVSVTQQFSTSNSMGRLTLNILLSFAQFEREIISERTRDKMAASRRKGKWMGGHPPLGYDISPRGQGLKVNDAEAEVVRSIFEKYREVKNSVSVVDWLNEAGALTKSGKPFKKATICSILRNHTYIGKVNFEGTIYEGEHAAIISEELWNDVQNILDSHSLLSARRGMSNRQGNLFKGILWCDCCGQQMQLKRQGVYRYYVCGGKYCPTAPLPADEFENAVLCHIREHLESKTIVESAAEMLEPVRTKLMEDLKRQASAFGETDETRMDLDRLLNADLQNFEGCFDMIWDRLTTSEKAKIVSLSTRRIGYDGAEGSVNIIFAQEA